MRYFGMSRFILNGTTILKMLALSTVLLQPAAAASFTFSSSQVAISDTPVGDVQFWEFNIGLDIVFAPGTSYSNPTITTVDYRVVGSLDAGNPSGFPAFDLKSEDINKPTFDPLTGVQFYGNGGMFDFVIGIGADLSDGVQVSELVLAPDRGYPSPPVGDAGAVFLLDAREIGTGRYHPPILILRGDGTGQLLNSNNTGVNGQTGRDIESDGLTYGAEYITNFTFDPSAVTLFAAPLNTNVSLPGSLLLLLGGFAGLGLIRSKVS